MTTDPRVLGLDIGGANIKLASDDGSYVQTKPFPMWTRHQELATVVEGMIGEYVAHCKSKHAYAVIDAIAVTMTGELADCFSSKQSGVIAICTAVQTAAGNRVPIYFYGADGSWRTATQASQNWHTLAASNWHAMANLCGQLVPDNTHLLIDIGSTSTDIIPLVNGEVATDSLDDLTRLQSGQLVYCGVERTPICSLVSEFNLDNTHTPVARELFATTLDVFLLSGDVAEQPHNTSTADGKPATRQDAQRRMARMICQCPELLTDLELQQLVQQSRQAVFDLLTVAMQKVLAELNSQPDSIIAVGQATFLITELAGDIPVTHLSDLWPGINQQVSRVGPALAVAVLLQQELATSP